MDDLEARLRELQEELSNVRSLKNHVSWKWLMDLANERIEADAPNARKRLENLLEIGAQQFDCGFIAGVEMFKTLPDTMIEVLEYDIENLTKELEKDERQNESRGNDRGNNADDGDARGLFEPPV